MFLSLYAAFSPAFLRFQSTVELVLEIVFVMVEVVLLGFNWVPELLR